MIDKIKELFGDRVIMNATDVEHANAYNWYQTPDGVAFGILVSSLTEKETNLLDVFLRPLPAHHVHFTKEQTIWKQLLFNGIHPDQTHSIETSRILQIQIQSHESEQELFEEAIQNMLSKKLIFLWQNPFNLLVIEPYTDEVMTPKQFKGLMQTIESDLYMKAIVFIGSSFESFQDALYCFEKESRIFEAILSIGLKDRVFTLPSSLPFYLLTQANADDLTFIRNQLIHEVEPELIDTVTMLLKCNLNYSLAAKNLFIHRNSLQYRMDKFSEKTGLDLKETPDAVTAYLLLQIK
ncbi:CdaR family transcriptional regulator [Alkalihalobacillus sp. AL-G]|uniref:PucR family transcriptional regulator n=1 Tax=Alkalihalobacillus sp. AL-G TaxID=2926399 RepID=UPI00272CB297|nr:helix-turn-helix domain-containing protein [Alkalihalobacillus sp. AL-G]WLD94041.1 helix-turn-helix domain-containing protein [Alkalihalobacillus sp. AL-G]